MATAPTRKLTDIKYITIHHSGVTRASGGARNFQELQQYADAYERSHASKSFAISTDGKNGYTYLSYHYMIARDGSVMHTQDEKWVRYHAGDSFRGAYSHNLYGIAICLDGNFEIESPTNEMKERLARLIAHLEKVFGREFVVRGHKATSQTYTACPGKNVGTYNSGWLKTVIDRANEIKEEAIVVPEDPEEDPNTDVSALENRIVELETSNKIKDDMIDALEKSESELNEDCANKAEMINDLMSQKLEIESLLEKCLLANDNKEREIAEISKDLAISNARVLELELDVKGLEEKVTGYKQTIKELQEQGIGYVIDKVGVYELIRAIVRRWLDNLKSKGD